MHEMGDFEHHHHSTHTVVRIVAPRQFALLVQGVDNTWQLVNVSQGLPMIAYLVVETNSWVATGVPATAAVTVAKRNIQNYYLPLTEKRAARS